MLTQSGRQGLAGHAAHAVSWPPHAPVWLWNPTQPHKRLQVVPKYRFQVYEIPKNIKAFFMNLYYVSIPSFPINCSSAIRNPSVPTHCHEDRYGSMSYWYYLILRPSWTTPSWSQLTMPVWRRDDDVGLVSGCPYRARQGCGSAREGHGWARAPMNTNDGSKLTSM